MRFLAILVTLVLSTQSHAWGRRGHQIVGEAAAMTVASEPSAQFIKSHAYDFGYYANVPDFIWKKPATYDVERNQHFMDMEHFEKTGSVQRPFELSRQDFEKQFPEIKESSGRAFWRIQEMVAQLEDISKQLRELKEPTGKERQALQEKWFLIAGPLGHYIGDLAQPMHVTENYDGQMTGQKGLHSYFEDDMVDELYPELLVRVNSEVKRQWPAFKSKNAKKSTLELIQALAKSSWASLPEVLAIDKKTKRDGSLKSAKKYEKIIQARLVEGSLYLAEIWRRNLGWKFDGNRFYFWAGEPAYIQPSGSSKTK